jgi:predicted glycosyltransferase involved in capsule biosynthesis
MRQVNDKLNKNAKKRGRILDYQKILYGYIRHNPLFGLDNIIHVYYIDREYIGKRIAVPVRMRVHLRQTYTDMVFREDEQFASIYFAPNVHAGVPTRRNETTGQFDGVPTNLTGLIDLAKRVIFPYAAKNQMDSHKHLFDNANQLSSSVANVDGEQLLNTVGDLDSRVVTYDFTIGPTVIDNVINFVVPLIGRHEPFKRFIRNFENVCLRTNENVEIAVVLFWNRDEDKANNYEVRAIMKHLSRKYMHSHLHLIETERNFSRSIGREMGADVFSLDSLLVFLDVDVIFTRDFLLRVRLSTIQHKQVFFPVLYSEFDPNPAILATIYKQNRTFEGHFSLTFDRGYWRQVGFGNIGTYKSDFVKTGGFDTSIFGWGKEDVDIYDKFSKSDIYIHRAADPGLVHVHHVIKCDDENLPPDQMIMCLGTQFNTLASKYELARIVHKLHLYDHVKNQTATNDTVTL